MLLSNICELKQSIFSSDIERRIKFVIIIIITIITIIIITVIISIIIIITIT